MSDYIAGHNLPPELAETVSSFVGRAWLLSSVQTWFSSSDSRAFVIVGPPGSGKTAFASWLTASDAVAKVLLARFCSLRDLSSGDALTFIESLATALGANYPGFGETLSSDAGNIHIADVSVTVGNVSPGASVTGVRIENLQLSGISARRAFDRVIRTPLESLPKSKIPFLVIVDGLDEALIDPADKSLLDILAAGWGPDNVFQSQVRLLVTTRASPATSEFISNALVTDINERSSENMADVHTFIRQRLGDMPDAEALANRIASTSDGNFLYARYVVDELIAHPDRAHEADSFPHSIEDAYRQNFSRTFSEPGLWKQRYRPILASLVVANRALSHGQIARLSALSQTEVAESLRVLAPYLVERQGLYSLYHQSLRDFLISDRDFAVYPEAFLEALSKKPDLEQLVVEVLDRAVTGSTATLAGIISDALPKAGILHDRLDLNSDVNALSAVMIARDIDPPLSIGLFGDWGTGKSFFMRLLQSRINALSTASRDAKDSAFCGNVRQITFNAWHYSDSNLWASLVTRILEGLVETETERSRLASALSATEERRRRLELEVADAQKRQTEAEDRLAELQAAIETGGRGSVTLRDLASAIAHDDQLSSEAERVADGLGLSYEDFATQSSDLLHLPGRLRHIWRLLDNRIRVVGAGIVAVLLAIFAIGAAVAGWGWWRPVSVCVASLALAAIAYLREVRQPVRAVISAAAFAGRLDRVLTEELRVEATKTRADRDSALLQERQAQTDLADLNTGSGFSRFVQDRFASGEYQQHLGLIAQVRADFERLSDLLREGQQGIPMAPAMDGLPRVERVILYIDDLDRCSAEKVVQVLEAVHLLLTFELFVVVVGVDSRWLLRSLRAHYSSHMIDTVEDSDFDDLQPFMPRNYLEKIFQIPYCLRRMDYIAFAKLMRSLLPNPLDEPAEAEIDQAHSLEDSPAYLQEADGATGGFGRQRDTGDDSEDASDGDEQDAGALRSVGTLDLAPPGLEINLNELRFMQRLWRLVRTPRSAKRLANTYRLLKASLGSDDLGRLIGRSGMVGDYQVVQVLTAMMVGYPDLVSHAFRYLMSSQDSDNLWKFAESLPKVVHSAVSGEQAGPRRMTDELLNSASKAAVSLLALRPYYVGDETLRPFKYWAPKVVRYSFDAPDFADELSSAPAEVEGQSASGQ